MDHASKFTSSWKPSTSLSHSASFQNRIGGMGARPKPISQTHSSSAFPSLFSKRPVPNSSLGGAHSFFGAQSNILPHRGLLHGVSKAPSPAKRLLEYLVTRNFIAYPVYIQSAITLIVALIAYTLWGSASSTPSLWAYLLYKVVVVALVALLCYLLSLLFGGRRPSNASTARFGPVPIAPFGHNPVALGNPRSASTAYNPFATKPAGSGSLPFTANSRPPTSLSLGHGANSMASIAEEAVPSNGSLFFTEQKMAGSAAPKESAPDFASSPTKKAAMNPHQIADSKTLSSFLSKRQQHRPQHTAPHRRMPSAVGTPIGKTFAMQMTPGLSPSFLSPARPNNSHQHQGSAMLHTPGSSSMDVTMESFHHDAEEPFPADFSAIEPSPAATAWNVTTTAFGGQPAAMDPNQSTLGNAGTPARHRVPVDGRGASFVYDSMYSDVHLAGERMGDVIPSHAPSPGMAPPAAVTLPERRTQTAPQSPYSRRRRRTAPKQSVEVDPVAFTAMGVEKSKFAADFMERSIALYRSLKIDGLIANWASDIKWWMGQSVAEGKWREIRSNDSEVEQLLMLLIRKYDQNGSLKEQLSGLKTRWQRAQFVASNRAQLGNVARSEQNGASRIMHIVQRTEHIVECMAFVTNHFERMNDGQRVSEYCFERIEQLQSTRSLTLYRWNGGDADKWQPMGYPVDAELMMALFLKYMDDALCPAIRFSTGHFVEIAVPDLAKMHRLEERVKDVAICCVSVHQTMRKQMKSKKQPLQNRRGQDGSNKKDVAAKDSLPYYFVAWNREKYAAKMEQLLKGKRGGGGSSLIKRPKAFLAQSWSTGMKAVNALNDSFEHYLRDSKGAGDDDDDEEQWGANQQNKWKKRRNAKHKETVSAWYPEPGNNNVFHTVTLFALFLQKCCDGKLNGISLRDQRCTLLDAFSK